ncbi:DUF2585 family protein [bacterium]|nr:DUF2585 family protein [bacterium]
MKKAQVNVPDSPYIKPIVVLLLIAAGWILHSMGRLWIAASSKIYPLILDAWSPENSQHIADPYSTSHFLHGIVFFWLFFALRRRLSAGARLIIGLVIEIGWEILENSPIIIERYRSATASLGYTGDTVLNSISDIVFCIMGYYVARRIGWRASVGLFVIIEVLMALAYRDNLTLNIIMLIAPSDAIRIWQMGAQ